MEPSISIENLYFKSLGAKLDKSKQIADKLSIKIQLLNEIKIHCNLMNRKVYLDVFPTMRQ